MGLGEVAAIKKSAKPTSPARTVAEAPGQIDGELLFEIVMALERAYVRPKTLGAALSRMMEENQEALRAMTAALVAGKALGDVNLTPVVDALTEKWIVYAGVEAGAAARIYNKVCGITDPAERARAIDREAEFFTQAKTLTANR